MSRPLLAALSVAAGFGFAALADDGPLADTSHICQQRPSYVSYGGLPSVPRFRRDHWVPLCLGGLDMRENCSQGPYASPSSFDPDTCNVWYEPMEESFVKDEAERAACRHACVLGPKSVDLARKEFRYGNWRKWLEP